MCESALWESTTSVLLCSAAPLLGCVTSAGAAAGHTFVLLATEVNKVYRRSGAWMLIQKPNNVFNLHKPHSALHDYRQVCSFISNYGLAESACTACVTSCSSSHKTG
jgi:hypothetical protein